VSARGQLPDADDLRGLAELTREQRELKLAALAMDARLALRAVAPLVALLPEPARTVVAALEEIVELL
jgi:hypothetical protein